MRFSLWLALRHLAKARRGGFLGRVSLLALLGVAVGVATLLTVFSFVQGFQTEVQRLLTVMNPAVFLSSGARGEITAPDSLARDVASIPGVEAASPFVQQKGVLSASGGRNLRLRGVILRGIDPETEDAVTEVLSRCDPPFVGFDFPGAPGLLLGSRLADELGALPGEELTFTTVLGDGEQEARHYRCTVIGTVSSGLYEFDRRFVYLDLDTARESFRAGRGVDGLGLGLADVMKAAAVVSQLRERYHYPVYQAAGWMELNGEIFRWMKTMRGVLFIALSLIILVAGFNIAGSMTIIVTEKTREIGLLLSLGATRLGILGVYLLEGWLIGLAGVLGGGLLGLLVIAWFSRHPIALPGEVYFIDSMPVELSPALLGTIAAAAIAVAFFSLVLPGLEALRRTPMDALREGGDIRA